jgi:hypothetical protein
MTVHGRPLFAKLLFDDSLKGKDCTRTFGLYCELSSLSLMGFADRRRYRLHAL